MIAAPVTGGVTVIQRIRFSVFPFPDRSVEPETARIAALPESPCPEYADFCTCGFHVPDIDLSPGTSGGIIGGFSHAVETEYRFRYQAYIRIFSCYPFYMSFSEIVTRTCDKFNAVSFCRVHLPASDILHQFQHTVHFLYFLFCNGIPEVTVCQFKAVKVISYLCIHPVLLLFCV